MVPKKYPVIGNNLVYYLLISGRKITENEYQTNE